MRKTFLLAAAIVIASLSLPAQKTRLGFTAGTAISNYHAKVDGSSDDGKAIVGITAGLLADVSLSGNFSFQPALNLTQKGTKDQQDVGGITEKVQLHGYHAELLLNCLYNAPSNAGNFFIGAGPSVSIGLFGKWKDSFGGDVQTENVKFGNSDEDDLKSLDLGANVLAGFCFPNGLLIAANFNQGLNNLFSGSSGGATLKSHYFGIRLGFLLNKKKK